MVTIMVYNNIANMNTSNLLMMNGRTQTSGTITTISVTMRRRRKKWRKIIQKQK